jgi:hypothetical protein
MIGRLLSALRFWLQNLGEICRLLMLGWICPAWGHLRRPVRAWLVSLSVPIRLTWHVAVSFPLPLQRTAKSGLALKIDLEL